METDAKRRRKLEGGMISLNKIKKKVKTHAHIQPKKQMLEP